MIINVTQAHIDNGSPCDGGDCPVALALADAYPDAKYIAVGLDFATVDHGGRSFSILLPEVAADFIQDFDAGNDENLKGWAPLPFAFEASIQGYNN